MLHIKDDTLSKCHIYHWVDNLKPFKAKLDWNLQQRKQKSLCKEWHYQNLDHVSKLQKYTHPWEILETKKLRSNNTMFKIRHTTKISINSLLSDDDDTSTGLTSMKLPHYSVAPFWLPSPANYHILVQKQHKTQIGTTTNTQQPKPKIGAFTNILVHYEN